MRFTRFHFGAALALGISMLCMSVVPVFADGVSAPTVSVTVEGSTVTLVWNIPAGAVSFIIRRGTGESPTTTTAGTLVATPTSPTTIYNDTNLPNGTYYYSIFAINAFDQTSPAGTDDPVTVSVEVESSSETTSSGGGGGRRGSPGRGGSAPAIAAQRGNATHAAAKQKPVSALQERVCVRALRLFRTNAKMFKKVNDRLTKRFQFVCEE